MDCLVISRAWMSRVLESVKLSSLAELWGSNLKSYENFSCEIVSYFLNDFFINGLYGFGELIVMNIL